MRKIESERVVIIDRVRQMLTRAPYLSNTRIAQTCGVGARVVQAVRSREFGGGLVAPVKDDTYFTSEEIERLDDWLRERGLLEEFP